MEKIKDGGRLKMDRGAEKRMNEVRRERRLYSEIQSYIKRETEARKRED